MSRINVTRSSMPPYEEYAEAIRPLWDSRWLTNMGVYHKQLEERLRQYLKVSELSLMVNGHTALEMTLQAFGFPEGAEVITTPFTFISSTHAIVRNRLVPVFCDIKAEDGTIDERQLEELITERTVAILPVHVYGNLCNTKEIERVAYKYGLKVVYDAAHAFGVIRDGESAGNHGDASVFSFHATKVYNTIEGGAVTFRDHWLYEKLYNLKNFGIRGEELVTDIGANGKMNEFCAIMGLLNLKYIESAMADRRRVYEAYQVAIRNINGLRMLKKDTENDLDENNYAYFPVVVEDTFPLTRDQLYDIFAERDIHVRKYFYPLTSDQACFKNKYKKTELPVARLLAERVLTLPIYEGMEDEDVERILQVLQC